MAAPFGAAFQADIHTITYFCFVNIHADRISPKLGV